MTNFPPPGARPPARAKAGVSPGGAAVPPVDSFKPTCEPASTASQQVADVRPGLGSDHLDSSPRLPGAFDASQADARRSIGSSGTAPLASGALTPVGSVDTSLPKIKRRKARQHQLPTLPPRVIPESEKVALATYEAELGGRMSVVAKLAHAQLDIEGYRFVQLMADPQNDKLSLAEICYMSNTPIRKVTELVKSALTAKATLLATMHIAEHTPAVALGVMQDAIPGQRTCEVCRGTSTVCGPDEGKQMSCPACAGAGVRHYEPELGLRKVALALSGLLSAGGKGAQVQITNNNMNVAGAGGASAALDKMTALTDQLLYGTGRDRLASADAEGDEDFLDVEATPVENTP